MVTYALLDGGATCCGVSTKVTETLQLPIRSEERKLSTFNYQGIAMRQLTSLMVESLDAKCKLDITEALVGQILTAEDERPPSNDDIEKYPYLEGIVTFQELDDGHVGLILSAKYAHTWELGERVSNGTDGIIAVKSAFGWGLIGDNQQEGRQLGAINCCAMGRCKSSIQEDLDQILRHDFIARGGEKGSPEVEHPSQDDLHAVKQLEATITFDERLGHYRCGIPWKVDRASAAAILNQLNTEANARNRLIKLRDQMRRDPVRREGIWKQVQEYIDEGHARKISELPVPKDIVTYYLPLLAVTRPDKPGRWRVCHDGAAKLPLPNSRSFTKLCLNDMLLAGPDLLNRLIGVLIRFRRHRVAISGDIRGFFHQVFVHEKDIPSFRFCWFEDKEMTKIANYEMTVQVFGAKSSPCVATWVVRHHAKRMEGKARMETLKAINKSLYVDDLMASFPTTEMAKVVRAELEDVMLKGGFELCKWRSTHRGVLSAEDDKAMEELHEKMLEDPKAEFPTEKVLGVAYSFRSDQFGIKISKQVERRATTRREMLRLIASVFDPLGLVAPATL